MCEEWSQPRLGAGRFMQWALSSGYEDGMQIHLAEGSHVYGPDTCVWRAERVKHARRSLQKGEFRGALLSIEELAAHPACIVPLKTLQKRLSNGMSYEGAATTPERWCTKSAEVQAFGETKSITGWSKDDRCTISADSLHYRLERGMPPEQAITLPRRR
jgi:hypothetical protein